MAIHTLEPAPTKAEMGNVCRLVLARKKQLGYRTDREVGEAVNLQASDISRLLSSKVDPKRPWGFARLSRVAAWVGVTLDGLLDREEGTTYLVLPGGARPYRVPVLKADRIITSRDDISRATREMADARTRLHLTVAAETGPDKAETVVRLVDGYLDRIEEIQKGFGS